ncbi:MAG: glycerol kinase GlpK [Candidatus Omnitrophica bacterium]|nr:glycerol kinase GlpK [Candidatus Omnitrophota bacterium]
MGYILAIDQGTTGSRVILYDKKAKQIASAYQEFPQYFPKPGWVEHNPEEIWQSVFDSIQIILKQVPKANIQAIAITNQRETTVVWDKTTGKPIYNAIVWQCRRTARRCDELKKKKNAAEFFRTRTGLPIDAYFSATKIEWILKNIKGARAKAKQGQLLFGTTDSWILWKLTDGAIHATDFTNASRTMLFNLKTLSWDEEILKIFNIPKTMLPSVKNSSGLFAKTAVQGKLASGIPVYGIAGDQQAALFGHTCFESGTMKNTYGTGCFLLLNTGKKWIKSKHGLITTLGCSETAKPVYVLEGAIFVAGAAIQWLRDELNFLDESALSEKMARSVKDNAGVYFVPALSGLGTPYWDQGARGSIFGITRGTKKSHIVRAALEAMCFQTKDVINAMEKDAGCKVRCLQVDGGAAANNFLCQFQADILGVKVIRPKSIEITCLGAAYLAGLGSGFWKNKAEIKKHWKKDKVFIPKMSKPKAAFLYTKWQDAVKRTLSNKKTFN